ncbi:MAG: hypothetical protein KDC93_05980 [Cyclobacteriaceae bacterium]|jgi:hypothetical protein|nr:hypothetical protein [Cyclobacteriaceae bacterium]
MKYLTVLVLVIAQLHSFAQLNKITDLSLSNVSTASVDRLGNFYFVLPSGAMQKYDPDGNLLDEVKDGVVPLTLLEPWNPLKVFTYSNKNRVIKHWDHHLALLEEKPLEPSLSITPQLVCPANEIHKAWILDVADFTIKKVNLETNQIEIDAPIPLQWATDDSNYVFMREYQNRIFLINKNKGILMLNMLGKFITSIEIKGLEFFNFMGEELCYRNGNDILLLDLFTGATRKAASLDNSEKIMTSIITDERLVLVRPDKVEIYALKVGR